MDDIEAQVRKFYSEIWNKKKYDEIPHVLHEDFIFRGSLGDEKHGHHDFREYVEYIHSCLSGYKCNIEELVIQPGKVFAKMKFSGLHNAEFLGFPPTNHEIYWVGAALFNFSGNKIKSLWVLGDLKGLETQLGEISSDE